MPRHATALRPAGRALLLGLLLALQVAQPPASALAARGWAPLAKVSRNDNTRSFEPAIALDSQGFSHVVWSGGLNQNSWLILYSNNRGGSFARPRVISRDRGEHREVDIAIGSDGHVHVVYAMRSQGQVYYVESPDLGGGWAAPYQVSRGRTGRADEPALAVDAFGNPHVVWLDNRGGVYQTFYATRAAGIWSANIVVSRQTRDDTPDIAASSLGTTTRLHIVFAGRPRGSRSNADYEIYYVSGTPGQLSAPRRLSDDDEPDYTPVIASDGAGGLFLAYDSLERAGHTIFFQRSDNLGATWTPPQPISPPDSTYPAISFGRNYNRPALTLAFQVGQSTRARVLTLDYYPQLNRFGGATDLLSTTRGESGRVALAGRPELNRTAAVYQGKDNQETYKIYTGARSVVLGATVVVNGGAPLTNNPLLSVALLNPQGDPIAMRIAVDAPPTAATPNSPFVPQFSAGAPARPELCLRSVQVQLLNADGVFSGILSDTIVVDTAATASLELRNPGLGAPGYTRLAQASVVLRPRAECSGLTGTEPALPAVAGGFEGSLALPPGPDGPRSLSVAAHDQAGNRTVYSATITLDTTPPAITGGRLVAPSEPLPSVLAALRVEDLAVRDNLFPGAVWAVQIASVVAGQSREPTWTTVQPRRDADGALLLPRWNVTAGLGGKPGDPALAEAPIELWLRALDGAGNPSAETLTSTVRLAPGYLPASQVLPLLLNP
jgi:hypothetical protein